MTPAVVLEDAELRYAGGRGLAGVSVTLQRGQVAALIGPSGAGKSTLLQLVAGIEAPRRGTVRTLGRVLATARGAAYRAGRDRVGMLQQADNLTPGLSVLHNVMAGRLGRWSALHALRNRVLPAAREVAEVRAVLDAVELGDRLHADPAELSGGEQQRVALARLAFQAPDLWLADEPTAGLDVRLREETVRLLLRLVRDAEGTAIVALHDLELLDAGFDQVWALREGRLVFVQEPDALEESALAELYEASP